MNPDSPKPSRDEIEARLTALLLGELSAEEATLLNWMIGQDAELAKLHERLKLAVDLTREAVTAEKAEAAASPTEPLKLSDARREKLLAQFKTVKPVEFVPRKRRQVSTLVAVAAVLMLMAVLAAMLLPALSAAKRSSPRVAAMNEARMRGLEQLMHEEAVAAGGPLPKDKVQSEKRDAQHNGEKVFSQNVVGFVDVQAPQDSMQLMFNASGEPIPATKSAEDRRLELANSIVLPQAETDTDQLGTMATANGETSARPFEQLAANAPLKLAITADEGLLGRSSESLREPAQSESQPQHFFRIGQPDSNGKEVTSVHDSEIQAVSGAHGADPQELLDILHQTFPANANNNGTPAAGSSGINQITSTTGGGVFLGYDDPVPFVPIPRSSTLANANNRPITPTTADSAINARATRAPQTFGGTTSSTPGGSRGSVASGNKADAYNSPNLSDASNRGRFQFGASYSPRGFEGGGSGNGQQGGQQANAPAQVAGSGIVTTTPVDESGFDSSLAYIQMRPSETIANGVKQDGFNLNFVDASASKQASAQPGTAATSGLDPNGWWSEDAKAQLKGYYDDNINIGSPEVALNATYTGLNSALSPIASTDSSHGTHVAGVVAGNGTSVDGTVSGPANQAGGIGGGRGGRGGASGGGGGFGGGGFGGAGGGGGGGGAAGGGRAGGRAAGRGGRGGVAPGAGIAGAPLAPQSPSAISSSQGESLRRNEVLQAQDQRAITTKYAPANEVASALNSLGTTATFSVDPNTHQIIVNSDASTYQQVQEVIKKLDVPARQVLVESKTLDLQGGTSFTVPIDSLTQDKVPVIGDLPMVGRLFRSETQPSGRSDVKQTTEFVGYDDPGPFVPLNSSDPNKPVTQVLPLPRFRRALSPPASSDNGAIASTPPPAPPSSPSFVGETRPYSAGGNAQATAGTYGLSSASFDQALSDVRLTGGLRNSLPTPAQPQARPASGGGAAGDSWGSFDGTTSLGWAIEPTEHTGILAAYSLNDNIAVRAGVAAPVVSPNGTRISDLEGQVVNAGGKLELNGRDTFSDGPFFNNGTLNVAANNTLTRDDVGGNRYLYRTDNMVLETGKDGNPAAANPEGTFPGSTLGNRSYGFVVSPVNQPMHQDQGNVGLADGSLQQNSSAKFKGALDVAANNNSPKNLGEEYRRNTPVLYYSSDSSFSNYFSPQAASEAVNNAYDVLSRRVDKLGTAESPSSASGEKVNAATLVQDGKMMLEMGKPAEAENKLKEALAMDPQNASVYDDLKLAIQAKYAAASKRRDVSASQNLVKVEKEWEAPVSRDSLPVPNQVVTTFTVSSGKPQQATANEAIQKLDALEASSKVLAMKIQAESLDRSIPQTAAVSIVDTAKPETVRSPTLLNRLTGKLNADYESVARIQVTRNQADSSAMESQSQTPTYDPYFIQNEMEVIKSEPVLNKAIEKLKLDPTWKTQSAEQQKIEIAKARELLKKNLNVESIRNTLLLDITVKSDKPEEAAKMANALASAYGEYRAGVRAQLSGGGIEAMQEQYIEQQKKIAAAKTELAQLEKPAAQQIADAKAEVERLRGLYAITDTDAQSMQITPSLDATTATSIKLRMEEDEADYQKSLEQLNALKKQNPNTVPNATLVQMQQRVDFIKASVNARKATLAAAASNDIARVEAIRPYYEAKQRLAQLEKSVAQQVAPVKDEDIAIRRVSTNAPIPQPEILASENNFSTFSLNVSDVSFKLAAASLEKGQLPDAASIRTEEFINAFDYRDPEAKAGAPVAFASERARYPFAHNRELLRFSMKTGAQGRQAGRPMNLVLLLDNSGSMERSDRVAIIQQALRVLASKLQPQDSISIITFARTPRLWVDGVAGDKARESLDQVGSITPEGGTNLEEAMKLAYETALRHYLANGANRVVLLTDGAANLGSVDPETLKLKVETFRKQGVALDCFGIGWEGFNDDLLEQLSSNGDGRYGFINSPEEAATGFAGQLAGALKVAAQDVKVQVEFNPKRVTSWRQIGYAKHQLTKQQFRDNTVDAAEIAAQEAGNALYTIETNPQGEGPVATVRVRYKIPGTTEYREQAWDVAYTGNAPALDQSSPAMRLAATASAFGEWLAQSPFAQEVTPDVLLTYLRGVPEICGADARPKQLETMIREAKSLAGK